MTANERIEEALELLNSMNEQGRIDYSVYSELFDTLSKRRVTQKVPNGYLSYGKLREINGRRPVYMIIPHDWYFTGQWTEVTFNKSDTQNAHLGYIGVEDEGLKQIDTYGKDWFCYMEDPFM